MDFREASAFQRIILLSQTDLLYDKIRRVGKEWDRAWGSVAQQLLSARQTRESWLAEDKAAASIVG